MHLHNELQHLEHIDKSHKQKEAAVKEHTLYDLI